MLALLFSLPFVLVLVKDMFDFREQGPPLLMSQGARDGSGGRRCLGDRRRCRCLLAVTLYHSFEVHFGFFCGGF